MRIQRNPRRNNHAGIAVQINRQRIGKLAAPGKGIACIVLTIPGGHFRPAGEQALDRRRIREPVVPLLGEEGVEEGLEEGRQLRVELAGARRLLVRDLLDHGPPVVVADTPAGLEIALQAVERPAPAAGHFLIALFR